MTILLTVLITLLVIPVTLFFRDLYVNIKLQRTSMKKYKVMKVLIDRLASKNAVTESEVLAIAQNPSLRIVLFRALEAYGRQQLFPKEFHTEEKGAESYMVNWLEFPTELGRAPDQILVLQVITIQWKLNVHYYAFKFKTSAPKWAKKLEWMIGVCGPYNDHNTPFEVPSKIFSRFNQVANFSAEAEVQWVHENINL